LDLETLGPSPIMPKNLLKGFQAFISIYHKGMFIIIIIIIILFKIIYLVLIYGCSMQTSSWIPNYQFMNVYSWSSMIWTHNMMMSWGFAFDTFINPHALMLWTNSKQVWSHVGIITKKRNVYCRRCDKGWWVTFL
jgi:hypothetical protein